MAPTLDGPPFCPKCGYQNTSRSAGEDDLFSGTNLYDVNMLEEIGDFSSGDAAVTNVMKVVRRPGGKRRGRVPGESIFDSEAQLVPGPTDVTPGEPMKLGPAVDENSSTVNMPPPEAAGTRPPRDASPLREGALFLPRCKYCDRPLETEEVAGGVCGACRRERAKRRRRRATFSGAVRVTVGMLVVLEALWVGALVLLAAWPDLTAWRTPEALRLGLREGLVVFTVVAAVTFARGRDWGAGAVAALGPVAATLTALQLRSDGLGSSLTTAAAWLGAGATGVLGTLVAITCFRSSGALPQSSLRRRRSGRTQRLERSPRSGRASSGSGDDGGEGDTSAPGQEGRAKRRSGRDGKTRAIIGGVLALAGAGLAGWQAVLAAGGDAKLSPETFPSVPAEALPVSGAMLGVAALCAAGLGLWLLVRPPAGDTHVGSVAAAVIAGGLPAWLLLGAFFLKAGLARPLAIVSGAALVVGAESISPIPSAGPLDAAMFVPAIAGIVVALAGSLWVLLGSSYARGRALAGFALGWGLVWGSGLAMAVALG